MPVRGTRIDGPMTVTVYSKPACQQCNMTKRYLDQKGIVYDTIDITEDEVAYEYVSSLGYQQAPVVQAGDRHWSGFNPTELATI